MKKEVHSPTKFGKGSTIGNQNPPTKSKLAQICRRLDTAIRTNFTKYNLSPETTTIPPKPNEGTAWVV